MSTLSGWPTSPPTVPSFVLANPDGTLSYVPASKLGYNPPVAPPVPEEPATIPAGATRVGLEGFVWAGSWEKGDGDRFTRDAAAATGLTFTGTFFELRGTKDAHHGTVTLVVDGQKRTSVPVTAAARQADAVLAAVTGLSAGQHTVMVTGTGTWSVSGARVAKVVVTAPVTPPGATPPASDPPVTTPPVVTPPATTPPVTTTPRGWVTKSATKAELLLDGKRYLAVGANGVKLTVKASRAFTDYDAYYKGTAPGWVDRAWFLPGMSLIEMDQIVAAAKKYGARLVVSLFDHANGVKLDVVKAGWAATYRKHVETVVARYRDEPTVIMYEVANEPPQDRGGFDLIGGQIKYLDPRHLVCTGTVPAWNDGGIPAYRTAGQSPAVDVLSIHEYDTKTAGVSAHLARHLAVARDLKKPIYVGEFGIDANADGSGKGNTAGNGAVTFARRGELITAKVDAYLSTPEVCGVAYWSVGRQAEGTAADSYLPITELVGIRALQAAVKKWGRN